MRKETYNLDAIADQAMTERGFVPFAPDEVFKELDTINNPAVPTKDIRDMRQLDWFSIDNDNSKDLDQITYAEKVDGKNIIYIAIADVDALVKKNSSVDTFAQSSTTSIYTPTKIYPMLPMKLSYNFTSLNENEDRVALVTQIQIGEDGRFIEWDVYPAYVHNHHKLTYNNVGTLLEAKNPTTDPLEKQLFLQSELAQKINDFRYQTGALEFYTAKLHAELTDAGEISLSEERRNLAASLIENFMIASNVALTRFLKGKQLPTLRRIVRVPKRWDRIMSLAEELGDSLPAEPDNKALQGFLARRKKAAPDVFADLSLAIIKLVGRGEYVAGIPGKTVPGHFDLALLDYSHTTAPNRRYPDVITQRILKSHLYNTPLPYTENELMELAAHCSEREDAANKVERRMLKSAAALALQSKIGTEYRAIITGKGENGIWVRTFAPPVEGKLVRGGQHLDVGDKLRVKLHSADVLRGFIDFIAI